jgi:magnesium chelatase subunit I
MASEKFHILPYSLIVGQEELKLALELAYIEPRVGGVLISGDRGTAKSTAVRAFSLMVYGKLPTTLPINATEDRVVGGWKVEELMRGKPQRQSGLLELANKRMLYVDEVNLLDDHIVNIILDVTSTHVLVVQREGQSDEKPVRFALVGTMNPEEGTLRPQLLDRFGLMVTISSVQDRESRVEILRNVLAFEKASEPGAAPPSDDPVQAARLRDQERKTVLDRAREHLEQVRLSKTVLRHCVDVATAFKSEGHRGEQVMALAARAHAALRIATEESPTPQAGSPASGGKATLDDVTRVARLAIQHRRPQSLRSDQVTWSAEDDQLVQKPVP